MTCTVTLLSELQSRLRTISSIKEVYIAPPGAILRPELPSIMIETNDATLIDKGLGNPHQFRQFKLYLFVAPVGANKGWGEGYIQAIGILDELLDFIGSGSIDTIGIFATLRIGTRGERARDNGVLLLTHHDNKQYWGAIITLEYKYNCP